MGTEQRTNITPATLTSTADLSGNQYKFVRLDTTADDAIVIAGLDDDAIGVVVNKPVAGAEAAVQMCNSVIAKITVSAGQTFATRGNKIVSGSDGGAFPYTNQHNVRGENITTGTAGQVIEVLLFREYRS